MSLNKVKTLCVIFLLTSAASYSQQLYTDWEDRLLLYENVDRSENGMFLIEPKNGDYWSILRSKETVILDQNVLWGNQDISWPSTYNVTYQTYVQEIGYRPLANGNVLTVAWNIQIIDVGKEVVAEFQCMMFRDYNGFWCNNEFGYAIVGPKP